MVEARWWMPTRSFSRRLSIWRAAGADLPVVVTQDLLFRALHGDLGDVRSRIQKAFEAVSAGRMSSSWAAPARSRTAASSASRLEFDQGLQGAVLLVDPYHNEVCIDCILMAREMLATRSWESS